MTKTSNQGYGFKKASEFIFWLIIILAVIAYLGAVYVLDVAAAPTCPDGGCRTATPSPAPSITPTPTETGSLPTPGPTETPHPPQPWIKTFLPMFFSDGSCNWQLFCPDEYCEWVCQP